MWGYPPMCKMDASFAMCMTVGDNQAGYTGQTEWHVESTVSAHLFDACGQLLHKVVHSSVGSNHVRDLRIGVQHGGVIAITEVLADLWE